jgi:hypothetical protein
MREVRELVREAREVREGERERGERGDRRGERRRDKAFFFFTQVRVCVATTSALACERSGGCRGREPLERGQRRRMQCSQLQESLHQVLRALSLLLVPKVLAFPVQ